MMRFIDQCQDCLYTTSNSPRAFTLLELMLSIGMVVIIIGSVGLLFSSTSQTVGTSQALLELLAQERAIGQLLRHDIASMNTRGTLSIRCRMLDPMQKNSYRFDEMAFFAYGSFSNPTLTSTGDISLTENALSNSCRIWWGHLRIESRTPPNASYLTPDITINDVIAPAGESLKPVEYWNSLPTGAYFKDNRIQIEESQLVLGRHIIISGLNYAPGSLDELQQVDQRWGRYRALASPYDSMDTVKPFVDAAIRMRPIVMAGVSSLKIDWSDGTTDPDTHQLLWFGPELFKNDPEIEWHLPVYEDTKYEDLINQAQYVAYFQRNNPAKWPKALRISFHVVTERLPGGRDFVEIVQLPE